MSTPLPGRAAAIAPATSPSRIRLHAGTRLAQLDDQVVVPVTLEDDDVDLARRLPERLGDPVHVLGRASA